MPAGHADAPGGGHADPGDAWDPATRGRPISLDDIDRLLQDSADVEHLDHDALRARRAGLTLVLESLTYARAILAGDAAVLRRAGRAEDTEAQRLVDDLPRVLDSDRPANQSEGDREPEDGESDADLFARTDALLSAHQEMAEVDLSSAFDVAGSLAVVEEQLGALTERQDAVEARLQEIRAAVIHRYEEGEASARDQPA